MRRFTSATLAALAAFGLASVASAGVPPLLVTHPSLGDEEFAGDESVVTLEISGGLDGGGILTDGEALVVTVNFVDAAGNVLIPDTVVSVVGGPINYDDALGNTIQVDLGATNLAFAFNSPTVAGLQFAVTTATGTGQVAVFDAGDETVDEVAEKDIDDPVLTSVFLNAAGDMLFLVFSEPLNTGDADNDDNHTLLADISLADLQLNATNTFDGTEGSPLGLSNPAFVGADRTTVSFDVDDMVTDIELGDFIRPTFDDMGDAMHDFRDIVGNFASDAAVQVTQLGDLELDQACAILTLDAGDGATPDVIRVTFNNPLDSVGDTDFFNALMLDGEASDLVVTAVMADPDDSSSVLLTVSAPGDDSIGPDAFDNDTLGGFTVDLDEMVGTSPEDIFGNTFAGADSFDIDDCIAPSLAAGFGNANFVDSDGDGTQDGVKLVFDEPLDADSLDVDGMELFANDGVTVHPVVLINLLTGERESVETDFPMETEIDIVSVELASTDVDDDGMISSRETNNTILITYDPSVIDWDGEDGELDGDAAGTTDDFGLVNVVVTAEDTVFTDAGGNAITGDLDVDSDSDCAAPVLLAVNYFAGDNTNGGFQQTLCELDGTPGDGRDNNIASLIFTEAIFTGGIEESDFRFGAAPSERFSGGDFQGTFGDDDNVLIFVDEEEGGFAPGDTLRILNGGGIEDDTAGNDFEGDPAGTVAVDRTSPFIPLQRDINGNVIASAFIVDADGDGFADRIDLFLNRDVDADTVDDSDFAVQGVDADDITVTVDGGTISIDLPDDSIAASSTLNVTYLGSTDETLIADADGNAVEAVDCVITARQVPTPASDGHFPGVMDVRGNLIGFNGAALPAGTKVFGFISVPVVKSVRGTMGNLTFTIDDSSSMEAMTNVLLGLEQFVYLYDDQGSMWLRNYKEDDGQDSITQLTVTIRGTTVTFTGRGTTTPGGVDSVPAQSTLTNGTVQVAWDVLRSDDGSARSLYEFGFGGTPIASSTVVADDSGNYRLHMTAPVGAFNGNNLLNSVNAPVIIVVELPTGERYAVTSLLGRVGGGGALLFSPTNRNQTAGSAPADTVFNVDLRNVGVECLFGGWNLMKYARAGGYATAANALPVLPRGVANSNIAPPSTLANATTLSQFVYFYDVDEDGVWTLEDDDDDVFDSLVIDVNCFDHFAFTLTSRGVQVSSAMDGRVTNGINNFVGGYAVGFFNGEEDSPKIGVFQYGAELTAGSVFAASTGATSFPNSNVTLGWALVSYIPEGETDTPVEFFSVNGRSDYLIEFNRTDHNVVNITTARRVTASTTEGDNLTVGCQALFVHFTN